MRVYRSLSVSVLQLHFLTDVHLLVKQKQDIKKQKAKLDAMQKEIEQAKDQARAAARERVLMEFEKGQRSLGGAINTITTSGAESTQGSCELLLTSSAF